MPWTISGFSSACGGWAASTFGLKVFENKAERRHRFLEEALELCQATGGTREEAIMLVDYVHGRETGEVNQEFGGVMVTLAVMAESLSVNLEDCAMQEYERINRPEVRQKIRVKQASKPDSGPLPGPTIGE